MWILRHIVFIWRRRYWQKFKWYILNTFFDTIDKIHFLNFFSRMANQKKNETSILTSDQNQDQRREGSKSQSDQD